MIKMQQITGKDQHKSCFYGGDDEDSQRWLPAWIRYKM